jgi:hypothetical protein
MLRRPRRTGLQTVQLPHPKTTFITFASCLLIYLAGIIYFNPALNFFFQANRSWRSGASRIGLGAAIIGGLVLLYLLRKVVMESAAARPGGIDITVISASPQTDVSANQVAAELRNALTDVHLSGPSVVPGESAPQDFLNQVRGTAEQSRSFWGFVVAAMSLLYPRNSYRVSCTEQADPGGTRRGLTVEVSGLPRQEASVTTVWAGTWPQVARHAACHIAAYVLPRTKLSRRPPWTPWHGIEISRQLFYSFDEARRLARAGRLEEALHHFDEAMRRDPLNPYIRIERATAHDQLGLWIDALASYVDAVTIESWFDRPVWKRYGRIIPDRRTGGPGWLTRSPSGAAALQVARYRAVCSLAAAQRLAQQWAENSARGDENPDQQQPARRAEADLVITRLRPLIMSYAELMMNAHQVAGDVRRTVRENLEGNNIQALRRVFQFAALEESAAICEDFRWYHHRRWGRLPISQAAIRVLPIWSILQYHYVEHVDGLLDSVTNFTQPLRRWRTRGGPGWLKGRPMHSLRWLDRINHDSGLRAMEASRLDWPPEPDGVHGLLGCALGRQIPLARFAAKHGWHAVKRGWHEHYNAACTLAVGMVTPELEDLREDLREELRKDAMGSPAVIAQEEYRPRNDLLVQRAINELSRAVVATDSQFAAGRSVWLRRGDQDLDDLRLTSRYAAFVERYLPDTQPVLKPQLNPTRAVVSRHIVTTAATYAALRWAFWRAQAQQGPVDAAEFAAEAEWWHLLDEVCRNYWDWRTRWKLIDRATRLADRLNKPNPDRFAITAATLDRERFDGPDPPEGPENCQLGRRVNEGQGWLDRRMGDLRHEPRQPRCTPTRAHYAVEMPIDRLDLLGKLLGERRPKLIAEAIQHAIGNTSAGPVPDPAGAQLAAQLRQGWETITNWLACDAAFNGGTPCFAPVTHAISRLSDARPPALWLPNVRFRSPQ